MTQVPQSLQEIPTLNSGRKVGSIDTHKANKQHNLMSKSHQINLAESMRKNNSRPFAGSSKMSIHPNKMLGTNESILPEEPSQRKVVNNIFISNLNINLNLNINISIPPSPRSTRNHNVSYMESHHSNNGDLIPPGGLDLSGVLGRKKSRGSGEKLTINLGYNGQNMHSIPAANQSSVNNPANAYGVDESGIKVGLSRVHTEKNEDLSLVDDEMTIRNEQVNSNVKPSPQVDMQGLIQSLIQPEVIYKSITQQIQQEQLQGASRCAENHIFINTYSVNNKEVEDREAAFLDPDKIQTVKINHLPKPADQSYLHGEREAVDDSISRNMVNLTSSMIKNQSQILNEEPIHHMLANDSAQDSKSKITGNKNVLSLFRATGIATSSRHDTSQIVSTVKIVVNKEIEHNSFKQTYLDITCEEVPLSRKLQALFKGVSLAMQSVLYVEPHLVTSKDDEQRVKLKEIAVVLLHGLKALVISKGNQMLIGEILYQLQNLVMTTKHGAEELLQAQVEISGMESTFTVHEVENSKLVTTHYEMKTQQSLISSKYPKISTKLNKYLQTQKRNTFSSKSNLGSPRTLLHTQEKSRDSEHQQKQQHLIAHNPERSVFNSSGKIQMKHANTQSHNKHLLIMTSPTPIALAGNKTKTTLRLSHYKPELKVLSQQVKKDAALKKRQGDHAIISERSENPINHGIIQAVASQPYGQRQIA